MTGTAAPPTALWVVPVSELGGVARHVLDVARSGLPGWRLVVLCPPGPLAERLSALHAAVVAEPFGPGAGLSASVASLRHAVGTLRPRVVHSHLAYADIVAALATAGMPGALVTTEHGIADDDRVYHGGAWRSRLMAEVHRARLRRADAAIAVSEATAATMRRRWRPGDVMPLTVVPNGVDSGAGRSLRPGLRVASISRLAPEKGLSDLLASFALVHRARPEALLTVAGEGPLDLDVRLEADRLGLADGLSFPGHVDAGELLSRTDVLVQLSVWENCSYSLLDAVTRGVGVVATPVGGNPEILPDRCLVPASDHDAVADAVVSQGLSLTDRPALPDGWPDVADMCRRVVDVYERLEARS